MNWTFLLFAFCLAVICGAIAASTLAQMRPHWSERRRLWSAALVLPALTLLLALVGIVWVLLSGPGEGENMRGLVLAAIAGIGGMSALLALAGGLVGAALRQRGMRK